MNTFLPSADFDVCAFVLDNKRLNNQLVDGIQLCEMLQFLDSRESRSIPSWLNHPVIKLWWTEDGICLLRELIRYLEALSAEWHRRPNIRKRHAWTKHAKRLQEENAGTDLTGIKVVWDEDVHSSQRANLLRKDYSHYSHYFRLKHLPIEEPIEGYDWLQPILVNDE